MNNVWYQKFRALFSVKAPALLKFPSKITDYARKQRFQARPVKKHLEHKL